MVGEHARQARELDGDHLVPRLVGDQARREQLPPDREDVVERGVHPGARIARRVETDPERRADRLAHVVRERHLGTPLEVCGEHAERLVGVDPPVLGRAIGSVPSNGRPDVCESRCRTVAPRGPAGSSRSTTPSSAAMSTASAVTGFDTEASRTARPASPRVTHAGRIDDPGRGELDRPAVDLAECLHARRY